MSADLGGALEAARLSGGGDGGYADGRGFGDVPSDPGVRVPRWVFLRVRSVRPRLYVTEMSADSGEGQKQRGC